MTNAYLHAWSTAFSELGIPVVLSRDMRNGSFCMHDSKYFLPLSQMSLPPTAVKAAINTVQSETSLSSSIIIIIIIIIVIITQNIHRQPQGMENSVSQ